MFVPPTYPHRAGLVAPVRVDASGLRGPTPGQARGRHWRRSSRGWYVPSDVPLSGAQRTLEASVILHPGAGITGAAALGWQGGRWFPGMGPDGAPLDVPVVTQRFIRPQRGVFVSQEFFNPAESVVVDGLPLTPAMRSVSFEARRASSLRQAIVVVDMAAYNDLVSIDEMQEYAAHLGPVTGIGQLRAALALADENAWSPTEVTMRQVWIDAGHPRPLTNVPIFDLEGRHIATPDLLDPWCWLAGEYEGGVHLVGSRRTADIAREGVLRRLGFEVVTMAAADLRDPSEFCLRLTDAYRRAPARTRQHRAWTTVPPPWWKPTLTVAQRRALNSWERERLLSHRRAA